MLYFAEKKILDLTGRIINYLDDAGYPGNEEQRESIMKLISNKQGVKRRITRDLRKPNLPAADEMYLNKRLREINVDLNYLHNRLLHINKNNN